MATTNTPTSTPIHRSPAVFIGAVALLAPISYFAGRYVADNLGNSPYVTLGSGLVAGALGAMTGIPVGLFFGSLRSSPDQVATPASTPARPNTLEMERSILVQLKAELTENRTLFEARKGSTTMFARIDYVTPFWTSIKASGRLFVMQDAALLNTIATAYYWLDQATHLEVLAYEAKYAKDNPESDAIASHLITEARLLDGQVESTLDAAILAIAQTLV